MYMFSPPVGLHLTFFDSNVYRYQFRFSISFFTPPVPKFFPLELADRSVLFFISHSSFKAKTLCSASKRGFHAIRLRVGLRPNNSIRHVGRIDLQRFYFATITIARSLDNTTVIASVFRIN